MEDLPQAADHEVLLFESGTDVITVERKTQKIFRYNICSGDIHFLADLPDLSLLTSGIYRHGADALNFSGWRLNIRTNQWSAILAEEEEEEETRERHLTVLRTGREFSVRNEISLKLIPLPIQVSPACFVHVFGVGHRFILGVQQTGRIYAFQIDGDSVTALEEWTFPQAVAVRRLWGTDYVMFFAKYDTSQETWLYSFSRNKMVMLSTLSGHARISYVYRDYLLFPSSDTKKELLIYDLVREKYIRKLSAPTLEVKFDQCNYFVFGGDERSVYISFAGYVSPAEARVFKFVK